MKSIMVQIPALAAAVFLFCCACTGRGGNEPEAAFFSGTLTVGESGSALFTDCISRADMQVETDGRYEELRRTYNEIAAEEGREVRIEFYGSVTGDVDYSAGPPYYDMAAVDGAVRQVRVDSLLKAEPASGCLTDYLLPGLYRSDSGHGLKVLKIYPRYTYDVEEIGSDGQTTVSAGRWYRTSLLTVALEDKDTGEVSTFQIVPEKESLSRNDGHGPEVYTREWL